jgi:O-antigen/teichoic acid export membrane protein
VKPCISDEIPSWRVVAGSKCWHGFTNSNPTLMPTSRGLFARTVTGAGWVIAWRLGMRVLGLISTLILVRLLVPADFGLLALAASFAQAIDGMMILGTEEAVIRTPNPDRDVYDTAWTMNVIRGLTVAAIVVASAGTIARFFNDQRLIVVLLVVALPPMFDGFSNIGTVDFRREMTFQKEFAIMVVPKMFGIAATLTAAFLHPSYTALLYGIVANQSLRSAMSYVMHPFRPRLSLRSWRGLLGYSIWTWLLSLGMLLRNRSDTLLLGRLMNSTAVGLYTVGAEVALLPTSELVEPLCRASFAGFAAAHREGQSAAETFPRLLSIAASVILPAGIGLALVAAPLVRLAFGPGWEDAVPVLRVLALAGAVAVFGQISLHLLSAHALLGRLTAVVLAGAALRIALLLLLIPRAGVTGAAAAAAIAMVLEHGYTLGMALHRLQVRWIAFVGLIARPAIACGAMAAAVTALTPALSDSTPAIALTIEAIAGAVVYVAVSLAAWFAAGQPDGAESTVLALLADVVSLPPSLNPWHRRSRGS